MRPYWARPGTASEVKIAVANNVFFMVFSFVWKMVGRRLAGGPAELSREFRPPLTLGWRRTENSERGLFGLAVLLMVYLKPPFVPPGCVESRRDIATDDRRRNDSSGCLPCQRGSQ